MSAFPGPLRCLPRPRATNRAQARHTGPMPPLLVDVYAAQAATGIKPGTIRVWLHRGKLTHHGHDQAGRTLVDLNEVAPRLTANAA